MLEWIQHDKLITQHEQANLTLSSNLEKNTKQNPTILDIPFFSTIRDPLTLTFRFSNSFFTTDPGVPGLEIFLPNHFFHFLSLFLSFLRMRNVLKVKLEKRKKVSSSEKKREEFVERERRL